MKLPYHGLTSREVNRLLKEDGLNLLPEPTLVSPLRIFFKQFKSFLVALLLFASLVSFVLSDVIDGILILAIVLINALIGFFQEVKAKSEIAALKKMVVQMTRVIRDGKETIIESKYLVVGDLVVLTSGDRITADGVTLSARGVSVDEASLTGESVPVAKEEGDQLFMGTIVLSGHVTMKVLVTGERSRFGEIAKNLGLIKEEKTPLELKIEKFSVKLGVLAIGLIFIVFSTGIIMGQTQSEMFFSSMALAVAAVPEGLPAVLTIALAVGASRLAKKKVIVRRLASVEGLGSVEVICTDKTGTLTKNEMTVVGLQTTSGKEYKVGGVGYEVNGGIVNSGGIDKELEEILRGGVLCNSSSLAVEEGHGNRYKILGDTTEGALLILAKKAGMEINELRIENPIIDEIPFDSDRKMMTVVVGRESYTKGAPEEIIAKASNLNQAEKERFLKKTRELGEHGYRILAMAKKEFTQKWKREDLEKELLFLGILAIFDPPREEVKEAIRLCKEAGIKVVMITGDSPETARAIAEQVGIISPGQEVITADQVREYGNEVLVKNLENVSVFARMRPEDKLRIVDSFIMQGKVVAVTGDGVNDSPSLKRANIGVAMGVTGTDVAKEAADLIITDDNFATIVTAISEGRIIFSNLIKAIKYLLASNFGEILTVCIGIFAGLPLILSPLALLWINLVGDGLPALALAADPHDGRNMGKKISGGSGFLNKSEYYFIGVVGVFQAVVAIGVFYYFWQYGKEAGRLAAFTAIVVLEGVVAFLARGKRNLFSNRFLVLAVFGTIVMQVVILLVPSLRNIFS